MVTGFQLGTQCNTFEIFKIQVMLCLTLIWLTKIVDERISLINISSE